MNVLYDWQLYLLTLDYCLPSRKMYVLWCLFDVTDINEVYEQSSLKKTLIFGYIQDFIYLLYAIFQIYTNQYS